MVHEIITIQLGSISSPIHPKQQMDGFFIAHVDSKSLKALGLMKQITSPRDINTSQAAVASIAVLGAIKHGQSSA